MDLRNIAILITAHNRKEKTIECLNALYKAKSSFKGILNINVYLTDDGSTDGTSDSVKNEFSHVKILKGNGSLFWAGGMRNSWFKALEKSYDAFLLLNDDTIVYHNLFDIIIMTHIYSITKFNTNGIYIGSTVDPRDGSISYSGWHLKNKFLNTYSKIAPNNQFQLCSFGNANIMLVTKEVVSKIGIFHSKYTHGIADFDYTLTASKQNIPVIIMPIPLGSCKINDIEKYKVFKNLSFINRIRYLINPIGLGFFDQLFYMKRHFAFRLPFIFISGVVKVLFPSFYIKINKIRLK